MKILLFDKPECPFCWKNRAALFFKGLSYETITVDTNDKPARLIELSSTGKVPLMLADARVIDDSSAIMQWLEQYPPSLYPTVKSGETDAAGLEDFSDKVIGPRIRDQIFMRRSEPVHKWDQTVTNRCQKAWSTTLDELESKCSDNGPWFLGDNPSVADCALGARFSLATFYGLTGIEQRKNLFRWFNYWITSGAMEATAPDHIQKVLRSSES